MRGDADVVDAAVDGEVDGQAGVGAIVGGELGVCEGDGAALEGCQGLFEGVGEGGYEVGIGGLRLGNRHCGMENGH